MLKKISNLTLIFLLSTTLSFAWDSTKPSDTETVAVGTTNTRINFQSLDGSSPTPLTKLVAGTSLEFEGATADLSETTLTVIDPTADRTITLPNTTGTVALLETIYPIGSIYISTLSTNPGTLLGIGTWTAFGTGRVLVGLDTTDANFDVVEETGGAKTHTLTTAEIPAHIHGTSYGTAATGELYPETPYTSNAYGGVAQNTGSTGGDGAHNNLQPYIVCYFWKRIS